MIDVEVISHSSIELVLLVDRKEPVQEKVTIIIRANGYYMRSDIEEWRKWRINEDGMVEWYCTERQYWTAFDSHIPKYWASIFNNWLADSTLLEDNS